MPEIKKLEKLRAANNALRGSLEKCAICPRRCGVNRLKGELGYCRAPSDAVVYSCHAHHGEEPPISARRGSGTIFFSHCNMKCVYCQNYIFSQLDEGQKSPVEQLSGIMTKLRDSGCHNINLVTPTHFMPQILSALEIACTKGLDIPVIYNTSGYELAGMIKLLDGIVDVYLPDMRYSDNAMAARYSDAPDYVEHNRAAVKEMHSQAGDLVLDEEGAVKKGVIIRLLALTGDISGTIETLKFIEGSMGRSVFLSIMSQYYPTFKALNYKELSRPITREGYQNVVDEARNLGLNNGWVQEIPDEPDDKFLGTNIKPKTEGA